MSRPGARTRTIQEKRLHGVILTAVRRGYTGAVKRAAVKMKEFKEKYSLFSPTRGKLLDFFELNHANQKQV